MMSASFTGYQRFFASISSKKWELSEPLKNQITQLAQQDAENAVYMGSEYRALLQAEAEKVAPDRKAAITQAASIASSNENRHSSEQIDAADEPLLYSLPELPYKAQFDILPSGTGIHILDENGDEIALFIPGIGWQSRSSQEEQGVYDSIKGAYYNAYHQIRTDITPESVVGSGQVLDLHI